MNLEIGPHPGGGSAGDPISKFSRLESGRTAAWKPEFLPGVIIEYSRYVSGMCWWRTEGTP
jgi:hypothetical protein